jgi:hypothetical protein
MTPLLKVCSVLVFWEILPKMHNLTNDDETLAKSRVNDIPQNTWLLLHHFRTAQVKRKQRVITTQCTVVLGWMLDQEKESAVEDTVWPIGD